MITRRQRKRRIVLYSLAGCLLVAVVVLTVLVYSALKKKQEYDRAVATLISHGSTLEYHTTRLQYPTWLGWLFGDDLATDLFGIQHVRTVDLDIVFALKLVGNSYGPGEVRLKSVDSSFLEALGKLDRIAGLYWNSVRFPPEAISHLSGLHDLKELTSVHAPLSDADMPVIAGLNNLESLTLFHTKVTDEGLKHLTSLTKLRHLSLARTPISGSGFIHLAGLSQLDTLVLSWTDVNDDTLQTLASLTTLKHLFLERTKVTQSGIDALKTALPQCTISVSSMGEFDSRIARNARFLCECCQSRFQSR